MNENRERHDFDRKRSRTEGKEQLYETICHNRRHCSTSIPISESPSAVDDDDDDDDGEEDFPPEIYGLARSLTIGARAVTVPMGEETRHFTEVFQALRPCNYVNRRRRRPRPSHPPLKIRPGLNNDTCAAWDLSHSRPT